MPARTRVRRRENAPDVNCGTFTASPRRAHKLRA